MYPISYKLTEHGIEFFYDQKEWNEWVARGKKTGDVGSMMKYIKNGIVTYFTFGTLENPMRDMAILALVHNPLFDGGELQEPDYYLKPLAEKRTEEYWKEHAKGMRMVFLDFSEDTPDRIIAITKPKIQ